MAAHSLGKALSGLSTPGKAKAPAKKGTATMTIEPMPKTNFTDKTLAPPKKQGMPSAAIMPLQKAGPGWKAQSAIGSPDYVPAPKVISKT
jgi:hypothetical protein